MSPWQACWACASMPRYSAINSRPVSVSWLPPPCWPPVAEATAGTFSAWFSSAISSPGAPVGHAQLLGGSGDGAGLRHRFQQLHLARADGNGLPRHHPHAQLQRRFGAGGGGRSSRGFGGPGGGHGAWAMRWAIVPAMAGNSSLTVRRGRGLQHLLGVGPQALRDAAGQVQAAQQPGAEVLRERVGQHHRPCRRVRRCAAGGAGRALAVSVPSMLEAASCSGPRILSAFSRPRRSSSMVLTAVSCPSNW